MRKRGQITPFIILGIVILILAGMVFFIRSLTVEKKLNVELIPALTETPSEVRPVRVFVEECLSRVSKDAIIKIGAGGGYIEPLEFGILTNFLNPTESQGIEFAPDSNLNIPYWRYLSSNNKCAGDCEFSSLRPPLYRSSGDVSIESQIDKLVNSEMEVCLDNFYNFENQGFDIENLGEIETTTLIGESDVSIFIEYPIKISKDDVTHEIERFYAVHNVKLKKMYDFAAEITEVEGTNQFLEHQSLNLISAFASLSPDSLPPKTESEFNFAGGTFWSKSKVKQDVEGMLSSYIGAIQIPFTLNYERRYFPGENIKTAFYAMEPPLNLDLKYSDLAARFDYLNWWPIYFDLNCNGDLCTPESANNPLLTIIGYQRYDFVYDISFPVVVSITDPEAFFDEGYNFNFALEANIRNNEAIDSDFPGYEGEEYDTKRTQLCDEDMRNSGNITIKTKDKFTRQAIADVNVMYTCGEESCAMGETDSNGDLAVNFPICAGGIVSFIEPDYFISAQFLNTKLEKDDLIVAEGYRFVDKNVSVEKWRYDLRTEDISFNLVNLEFDEQIIFTLTRIPDSAGEEETSSVLEFWGNQTGTSELLRMIPGNYEVNAQMILNREVIIPEETRKTGVGLIGSLLGADEEITIPEVRFEDSYPSGGLVMNKKTGYLKITPEDLYNNDKIIFSVIGYTLPTKVEHTSVDLEKLSSKYRDLLYPNYQNE